MTRPPVLFLPGTLCTPSVFDSQISALVDVAPRIEALRFTSQDSIALMADLAIAQIPKQGSASIIGFSMGGMVAMEIVRRAPQLVEKLALLNTNFLADTIDKKATREKYLKQARSSGIENVVRHHLLQSYLHRPTPGNEELIITMAGELGSGCYEAQHKALATRPDFRASLPGIKCPTLVLAAAQDKLCALSMQTEMHQMIENSELVTLMDCGHFSTLEQASAVNSALLKWYLQN